MSKRRRPPRKHQPGQVTHGGYALYRMLGRGEVSVKTWLGRLVQGMREQYALAYGYAMWESVPKPLQAAIKQAVRLELFAERLFAPFWDGVEPPKRFDTVGENLRRVLNDMGLEPRAVGKNLQDYVRERYGAKDRGTS